MKNYLRSIALMATLAASTCVQATTLSYDFTTDAYVNSSASGVGAVSADGAVNLVAGQAFTVTTSTTNGWTFDGGTDYATANGMTGWNVTNSGLTYYVGTLVGEIDGIYQVIGAGDVDLVAWATGSLTLYFLDIDQNGNAGSISSVVSVNAVPEPGTMALMAGGLVLLLAMARRRQRGTRA